MYTRDTLSLPPIFGIYGVQLAGCERAYIIGVNTTGAPINYIILAQGPFAATIVNASVAAGAVFTVNLPNNSTTPPLPLPDAIQIGILGDGVSLVVHRDYRGL